MLERLIVPVIEGDHSLLITTESLSQEGKNITNNSSDNKS